MNVSEQGACSQRAHYLEPAAGNKERWFTPLFMHACGCAALVWGTVQAMTEAVDSQQAAPGVVDAIQRDERRRQRVLPRLVGRGERGTSAARRRGIRAVPRGGRARKGTRTSFAARAGAITAPRSDVGPHRSPPSIPRRRSASNWERGTRRPWGADVRIVSAWSSP